ncbi:hypothetical protein [Rhizobium sp. SGZ-381]
MAYVVERPTRTITWPSLRLKGPIYLLIGRCALAASFAFVLFMTLGF